MTNIEWTGRSWNPVVGCLKVSEGCRNCYAEKWAWRLKKIPRTAYKYRRVVDKNGWRGLAERADNHFDVEAPHYWKKPQKIFVCSMGDLFHAFARGLEIDSIFETIEDCPHHTFQILTKRPLLAKAYFENYLVKKDSVPENIWFGVSVERLDCADRINVLRELPVSKRFISFEPLIGPVGKLDLTGIHQVIVGGESGPGARPMKAEWVDEIFQQAKAQGVAFFFKQWGEFCPDTGKRVGKKKAGRIYKGQTWDEMPDGSE